MKPAMIQKGIKGKSAYIKGILTGIITGSLTIVLLLLIVSFVITSLGNIPTEQINIVVLCIEAMGVFAGSYFALRIIKSGGMLWGAVNGCIIFLIIMIAGLMSSTDTISTNTLFKLIISVICGILGGIIAVNKKKKVRYK